MPQDNIFDATTGQQIAWVSDGKVFDVATQKQVGTMRHGNLYSLDGELVGHVEDASLVHKGGKSDAFMKLLKVA